MTWAKKEKVETKPDLCITLITPAFSNPTLTGSYPTPVVQRISTNTPKHGGPPCGDQSSVDGRETEHETHTSGEQQRPDDHDVGVSGECASEYSLFGDIMNENSPPHEMPDHEDETGVYIDSPRCSSSSGVRINQADARRIERKEKDRTQRGGVGAARLVASHRASTGKAATFDSSSCHRTAALCSSDGALPIGFFEGSIDGRLSDVLVKNVSVEDFEDKKGGGRHDRNGHDRNGPSRRREPSIVNEPTSSRNGTSFRFIFRSRSKSVCDDGQDSVHEWWPTRIIAREGFCAVHPTQQLVYYPGGSWLCYPCCGAVSEQCQLCRRAGARLSEEFIVERQGIRRKKSQTNVRSTDKPCSPPGTMAGGGGDTKDDGMRAMRADSTSIATTW
jgi:hypothetical protein